MTPAARATMGPLADKATLTIAEAATVIGVSEDHYRRAAVDGEVPIIRIRRRVVVPTAGLLRLLGLLDDGSVVRVSSWRPES